MPGTPIGLILSNLPELQALKGELDRLRSLEGALKEILPGNLALSSRVSRVTAGELVVSADSGAIAAKLKEIAPRILAAFRQRGYEITGIVVQVQVRTCYNPLPQKQIHIGSRAISAVESLVGRLNESPLKAALERLVRHTQQQSD